MMATTTKVAEYVSQTLRPTRKSGVCIQCMRSAMVSPPSTALLVATVAKRAIRPRKMPAPATTATNRKPAAVLTDPKATTPTHAAPSTANTTKWGMYRW